MQPLRSVLLAGLYAASSAWVAAVAPVRAQQTPEEDVVLGAPPAFDLSGRQEETLWVEAEARLHRQPARRSPTLTRFVDRVELPVLERRGSWARVRYGSWQGWVLVPGGEGEDGEGEDSEGQDGEDEDGEDETWDGEEPWWTPRAGPDRRLLDLARGFLDPERSGDMGPYRFFTDVDDDGLVTRLSRLAARLPAAFEARFGLASPPDGMDTVVLYRREESYRAFAEAQGDAAAYDSLGHAIGGLAVLTAGERKNDEVRSLLVHELVHILTYRALGPNLPTWLAEGLADDLAYCRVASSGEIQAGTLDGWRAAVSQPFRREDGSVQFLITTTRGGPTVSLEDLRRRWRAGEVTPLEVLLALPRPEFMAADRRQLHYAMSAFLVRYLVSSPAYRQRFHGFLRAVAEGANGDGDDLLGFLDTSWDDLQKGFANWLFTSGPESAA